MTTIRSLFTILALALCAAASAADGPTPAPEAVEAPAQLDPVVLTADQRVELSVRVVQIALERGRSDRMEDEGKIVCMKQEAIGSHRQVINCATNRYWRAIRNDSLGSLGGFGGGGAKKEDQVFTMSVDDYYKLEKRFGKLPKEMLELADK